MSERSARPEVRNPILALPEMQAFFALPREQRLMLWRLALALSRAARANGEKSWAKRKPPMAAYWAASATWVKHFAHAVKRGGR